MIFRTELGSILWLVVTGSPVAAIGRSGSRRSWSRSKSAVFIANDGPAR